jgi:hypothetical protein
MSDTPGKAHANRMLIVMVVVFGVCWLPLTLINILRDMYTTPLWADKPLRFLSIYAVTNERSDQPPVYLHLTV